MRPKTLEDFGRLQKTSDFFGRLQTFWKSSEMIVSSAKIPVLPG